MPVPWMLWDRVIRFNDLNKKLGYLFNNISQVLQHGDWNYGDMVGGLISYIAVVDF